MMCTPKGQQHQLVATSLRQCKCSPVRTKVVRAPAQQLFAKRLKKALMNYGRTAVPWLPVYSTRLEAQLGRQK